MLGEAATGVGAVGVALTARALVGEPHGVWKVRATGGELGLLVLFFSAYGAVCYDAGNKQDSLVGAIIILFVAGMLPASVGSVADHSRPMLPDQKGSFTQATWSMSNLARVGLVGSTTGVLMLNLLWHVRDVTGIAASSCLMGLAVILAIHGMPVARAGVDQPNIAAPPKQPRTSSAPPFIF
jgi:hypothetical protein